MTMRDMFLEAAGVEKPIVRLVGEDGNAFFIMGRWDRAASKAGWSKEDRKAVLNDARSGDYDHLLQVIMANSEEPDSEDENWDD